MVYALIFVLILFVLYVLYKEFKHETPDGAIVITQVEDDKTLFSLELDIDPGTIKDKKRIVFEVVSAE